MARKESGSDLTRMELLLLAYGVRSLRKRLSGAPKEKPQWAVIHDVWDGKQGCLSSPIYAGDGLFLWAQI